MKPKYVVVKRNKDTYFDNPWKILNKEGRWTQDGINEFSTKKYDTAFLIATLVGSSCVVNLNKDLVGG